MNKGYTWDAAAQIITKESDININWTKVQLIDWKILKIYT